MMMSKMVSIIQVYSEDSEKCSCDAKDKLYDGAGAPGRRGKWKNRLSRHAGWVGGGRGHRLILTDTKFIRI